MIKRLLKSFILLSAVFLTLPAFVNAVAFFSDGFESGDMLHTENGAGWFSPAGSITASTGRAHTGSYSSKYHFPGVPIGDDNWVEQRFTLGTGKTDVYIRYYIFFPSNYVHRNDSPTNNKAIMLWDEEGNYVDSRTKMGGEFWYGYGSGDLSTLSAKAAIDFNAGPTQYHLTCTIADAYITDIADYISGFGTWSLTSSDLNKWLLFEWHFKLDSGAGNGALEFFVDGVKKFGRNDLAYDGAPCAPGYFKIGYLMGWANAGFTQDTDIYIDDVVFSTTYVGPLGSSGPTTPAAPAGLSLRQ
jgi:hypothetical protein